MRLQKMFVFQKKTTMGQITYKQYKRALARIEELLPLVGDDTPADDPNAKELMEMSELVIEYEKKHF